MFKVMRIKKYQWAVSLAGTAIFATAASAQQQDQFPLLNSTNRLTLSFRFGLNISARFKGFGSGGGLFASGSGGNGRFTKDGSPYNYEDGYVLTDSTGDFLNFSSYWGYDNASQYNQVANTFAFHNSSASGISTGQSPDSHQSDPGFELTYDRQFGKKRNWHDMHYGLEGAFNYLNISFNNNSISGANVSTTTDTYQFGGIAGQQPAPGFQGRFAGNPGDPVMIVPMLSSVTSTSAGSFLSHDAFNGDLWGFRLGPYVEFPMSEKWSLHLSGGLALGLLDDNELSQQTLNVPGIGTLTASGQSSDFQILWGYYISLDAVYQFNQRWGIEGGVQFEDLGTYDHTFTGREVQLDLSRSLFVQVGVSYSF
jgi:hypothetical protein